MLCLVVSVMRGIDGGAGVSEQQNKSVNVGVLSFAIRSENFSPKITNDNKMRFCGQKVSSLHVGSLQRM